MHYSILKLFRVPCLSAEHNRNEVENDFYFCSIKTHRIPSICFVQAIFFSALVVSSFACFRLNFSQFYFRNAFFLSSMNDFPRCFLIKVTLFPVVSIILCAKIFSLHTCTTVLGM